VTAQERNAENTAVSEPGRHDAAQHYEITVQGHLAARWSTWFDGLELTRTAHGTTVISGPIVDQSALHGLLQKLRDLGIPLIALTSSPFNDDTTKPERS
jgi:hypothetical protein